MGYPIERYENRLRKTREMIAGKMSIAKGATGEKIAESLDRIRKINNRLSWMPKPGNTRRGTIGEGTAKMANGQLP